MSIDHGEKLRKGIEYVYVKRTYARAVRQAGGRPFFICPDLSPEHAVDIFDGIIIPGGDDVPPILYTETQSPATREESWERVEWDRTLIELSERLMKPVLGICYGMQLINVHYGGTLYQELSQANRKGFDHGGNGRVTSHEILIPQGSFLYARLGPKARVSSAHHQAVKALAPGFRISASSEDGIIEGIESDHVFGVEWHPESDETGHSVYSFFIAKVNESARTHDDR